MYLSFDHLTKYYGSVAAVRDITFAVEQGEFVSLLGPSGCGKTTTLMLLAGFEAPDTGRIMLDGNDLAGLPPEKREVGVVFQHYALFPHMTVAENIAFGLVHGAGSRLPRATVAARVAELLDIIDLAPLAQRKPAELSAGQQQRVAIARSLAPRPRVLCFDEPLSALDALLREKLRLEIRRLQRELGLTVLYVTHDQEEALAISDRIVVMNAGRVVQVGSPWEIYDRPATHFTAGFIGKGSLLEGKITACDARIMVTLANDQVITVPASAWCGQSQPQQDMTVDVVLRAERASVVMPSEPIANHLIQLSGRLQEVEFLGGLLRLHITADTGSMTVVVPATSLMGWQARTGSQVVVTCRPEDVRLAPITSR